LYTVYAKYFQDIEEINMNRKLKVVLSNMKHAITFHARLKKAHIVLRLLLRYPHILRRISKKTLVIYAKQKLVDWESQGMSKKKCKFYKTYLDKFI
jgi:hypothetical protein